MFRYRVIKDYYGYYVVERSEDEGMWRPISYTGSQRFCTLWGAKLKLKWLVWQQAQRLADRKHTPKVVYGPYP